VIALHPLLGEASELYSPVGLRLVDELTGSAPLGKTEALLDLRNPGGTWRTTDIRDTKTLSGIVCYPGLERHGNIAGLGPRHYRVRIVAEFYVPLYRRNSEGIEFDAFPYNDTNPPQVIVRLPQDAVLTPGPNYPFDAHVPVLRGKVVDSAGAAVPDAVVTQGLRERVLTDGRGTFALPCRWVPENTPVAIDAADERTGRLGTINVQLPGALGMSQKIQIS
jgi:hypothetical protein